MLWLKLIHVNKRGPRPEWVQYSLIPTTLCPSFKFPCPWSQFTVSSPSLHSSGSPPGVENLIASPHWWSSDGQVIDGWLDGWVALEAIETMVCIQKALNYPLNWWCSLKLESTSDRRNKAIHFGEYDWNFCVGIQRVALEATKKMAHTKCTKLSS